MDKPTNRQPVYGPGFQVRLVSCPSDTWVCQVRVERDDQKRDVQSGWKSTHTPSVWDRAVSESQRRV